MADQGSERRPVAVTLAAVAGFVDAAGFLALDLFTAHMSGNSARLGVYIGDGLFVRAAPSVFSIALFVIGIAAGTATTEVLVRAGRRWATTAVLCAELLLLVALAVGGWAATTGGHIPHSPADVYYPLAGAAVLAMGLQTASLQRVSGRTVRTTYVSGMLTNLAEEAVALVLGPCPDGPDSGRSYVEGELGIHPGPASVRRILFIAAIWLAYAAGAVGGGYLERRIHLVSLAVPCALLGIVIIVELARRNGPLEPVTEEQAAGSKYGAD